MTIILNNSRYDVTVYSVNDEDEEGVSSSSIISVLNNGIVILSYKTVIDFMTRNENINLANDCTNIAKSIFRFHNDAIITIIDIGKIDIIIKNMVGTLKELYV